MEGWEASQNINFDKQEFLKIDKSLWTIQGGTKNDALRLRETVTCINGTR